MGEFEFASSVRVCAPLPAQGPAGGPSRLVCGDDRGRLHCLLVDLQRVPVAAPRELDDPECELRHVSGRAARKSDRIAERERWGYEEGQ